MTTDPDLLTEARIIARREVNRLADRLGLPRDAVYRNLDDMRVGHDNVDRLRRQLDAQLVLLRTMARLSAAVAAPPAIIMRTATT